MNEPFNVMQQFILARNRLFRVYLADNTLYFIRIGGQLAYAPTQPMVGGGAAQAAAVWMANYEAIMPPEKIAEYDKTPPAELLGQHKHDTSVSLDKVVSSKLEPYSFFRSLSAHLAKWTMMTESDGKIAYAFVRPEDLIIGIQELPKIFANKIHMAARWDDNRQKCVSA